MGIELATGDSEAPHAHAIPLTVSRRTASRSRTPGASMGEVRRLDRKLSARGGCAVSRSFVSAFANRHQNHRVVFGADKGPVTPSAIRVEHPGFPSRRPTSLVPKFRSHHPTLPARPKCVAPLVRRVKQLPPLATFARRPREALMWIPRASDIARIAAVCRVGGTVVADVGAGTGLLAHLLEAQGVSVAAYDPTPPAQQFHPIETLDADALSDSYDVAIVSWMEAGKDYRDQVAEIAPIIVNAYDTGGGCGVLGATDFKQQGFQIAATWETASFEDAAHALDHRGERRKEYPGNRVDILTRKTHLLDGLRDACDAVHESKPLPWEAELDKLGL